MPKVSSCLVTASFYSIQLLYHLKVMTVYLAHMLEYMCEYMFEYMCEYMCKYVVII